MNAHETRRFRPRVESIEDRCLLSQAVVDIANESTYTITFNFRWTSSSSWTPVTETPGQDELLWTTYTSGLTPQVSYDTTSSAGSGTTVTLAQGYGEWGGSGNPPESSASVYQFQNTLTGLQIYYASPPTPTVAVAEVLNDSMYTITFGFRWTTTSTWSYYTEGPGQGEIFWTDYSDSLTPEANYNSSTSSGSQATVLLAQGYGQWTGNGAPPASSASLYQYENTSTGVQLYYAPVAPAPTPAPAQATSSPNWSGYVAASSLSNPQANSVTAVTGSWNVPAVSGSTVGTVDSSTWIGIDGFDGGTVEQIGTEQDVVNGAPVYRAWWEMYSSGDQQPEQIINSMTISPGDSISASVQYITSGPQAGLFHLVIVDNSRANDAFDIYESSSATQSPLAEGSTAEWIMEAPSVGGQIAQMPDFSTVDFTNATAVINGVSGPINSSAWQSMALNLASNGVSQDTTSVLTNSGQAFSVTSAFGVGASVVTSSGLATAEAKVGSDNPQVVVVGYQWPVPGSSPPSPSPTSPASTGSPSSGSSSGALTPSELAALDSLLAAGQSSPPAVLSAAPLEQDAGTGHHHGKKAGHSTGFALQFNRALDAASASNAANYQVFQSIRRGQKILHKAVAFGVSYDPTTQTVDLVLHGKPRFSDGGMLTVLDSNLIGASGARGVGQTSYTILRRGRGLSG
jgi:hypothetical protein